MNQNHIEKCNALIHASGMWCANDKATCVLHVPELKKKALEDFEASQKKYTVAHTDGSKSHGMNEPCRTCERIKTETLIPIHVDEIGEMTRDFCKIGGNPKSAVKSRLVTFAMKHYNDGLIEGIGKGKQYLATELNGEISKILDQWDAMEKMGEENAVSFVVNKILKVIDELKEI